jgi:hypothetical protein
MATRAERSRAARIAVNAMWAQTPDRTERLANAHNSSPVSYGYWLKKIQTEGKVRKKDQAAAAESAHRTYMSQLSLKAAKARAARARNKTTA